MEFVSDQYDDLIAFKVSASKELEEIRATLDKISETCDRIQKSLDAFELYSYQFKIKIVGMPMVAEREHPEQTANLCLQLFSALRVKGVTIQDIDRPTECRLWSRQIDQMQSFVSLYEG